MSLPTTKRFWSQLESDGMRLKGTIWLREVVDKLALKHGVETNEVEEISTTNQRSASLKEGSAREKILPGYRPNRCWEILTGDIHPQSDE